MTERILMLAATVVTCTSGLAVAHPHHVSVAEAAWNAKTKQLEVALKLHPGDLEQALRRRFRRHIVLEKTADVDQLIQKYLAEVFAVQEPPDRVLHSKWIGKELSVRAVWLYFEVPMSAGPDGAIFSNRALFELLPDQANTINVRAGNRRSSLTLTVDRAKAKLKLPPRR